MHGCECDGVISTAKYAVDGPHLSLLYYTIFHFIFLLYFLSSLHVLGLTLSSFQHPVPTSHLRLNRAPTCCFDKDG